MQVVTHLAYVGISIALYLHCRIETLGLSDPLSYLIWMQVVTNLAYVSIWIALSGTVILYNKWILAYYGFPYPIALTIWHMTFSSGLAFLLVRSGYVQSCDMSMETYLKAIVPIGACFSGTLWLGNAAYLYLSVSFIQMLKVSQTYQQTQHSYCLSMNVPACLLLQMALQSCCWLSVVQALRLLAHAKLCSAAADSRHYWPVLYSQNDCMLVLFMAICCFWL